MKLSLKAAFLAAVVLVPALAFADQSPSAPLTRAQVRDQLVQLEKAGFDPANDCSGDCPGSLKRAEAAVAKQQTEAYTAYGSALNGTVQSGK
jgi:hypothetical protein